MAVGDIAGLIAGQITGAATGSPEAATLASGVVSGKAPEQIATNVVSGFARREGMKAAARSGINPSVAAPAFGYTLGVLSNVAREAQTQTPNYGYAVAQPAPAALGAMVGGMFAGPLGAMIGGLVGGYFGQQSFDTGVLGDVFDSRYNEAARDIAESVAMAGGAGYLDAMDMSSKYGLASQTGDIALDDISNMVDAELDTTQQTREALGRLDYSDMPSGLNEPSGGIFDDQTYSDFDQQAYDGFEEGAEAGEAWG